MSNMLLFEISNWQQEVSFIFSGPNKFWMRLNTHQNSKPEQYGNHGSSP